MICGDNPTNGLPPPTLYLTHPPTYPPGDIPPNQEKRNKTWTNQDILIVFKDLKSVETPHPWLGAWLCGWVSGWLYLVGRIMWND